LDDDNNQNEDEVHILEKTPNHIALEEAINSGTRIKKKIDEIDSIISNQVHILSLFSYII
jgi:hypothetical protein